MLSHEPTPSHDEPPRRITFASAILDVLVNNASLTYLHEQQNYINNLRFSLGVHSEAMQRHYSAAQAQTLLRMIEDVLAEGRRSPSNTNMTRLFDMLSERQSRLQDQASGEESEDIPAETQGYLSAAKEIFFYEEILAESQVKSYDNVVEPRKEHHQLLLEAVGHLKNVAEDIPNPNLMSQNDRNLLEKTEKKIVVLLKDGMRRIKELDSHERLQRVSTIHPQDLTEEQKLILGKKLQEAQKLSDHAVYLMIQFRDEVEHQDAPMDPESRALFEKAYPLLGPLTYKLHHIDKNWSRSIRDDLELYLNQVIEFSLIIEPFLNILAINTGME